MPKRIRIDGVIGREDGQVSAAMIAAQLPKNGTDPIRVSMHTEGGSVFEGFAIHDLFASYEGPKTLAVESTAFSIGSFIATAFDDVEISPNGYFMLHNPRIEAIGDDDELMQTAGRMTDLKKNMVEAYAKRSGKSVDEIQAILKAETYMNAEAAIANGFADRMTSKPVSGRPFARLDQMPHGVVTALFGAGSGGEEREPTKEQSMSDAKPVAATVQEIKAAYPKAKAEFVLNCIEKAMPMASVATAAAEEMMKENEELKAKVAAMEGEVAKAKAEAEAKAEETPADGGADSKAEAKAEPTAKKTGVDPVARATSGKPSATARWNDAIESSLTKCNGNKMRAVAMANRMNPGLREAYLAEANS